MVARLAAILGAAGLVGGLTVALGFAAPDAAVRDRHREANAACAAFTVRVGGEEGPAPRTATAALGRFPRPAPPLVAHDYEGREATLSSYRGRVVFLNFWATWCDTCVEEMPSMDALQRRFKQFGLAVVAVSADESWEKILTFFRGRGQQELTLLRDPGAGGEGAADDPGAGPLAASFGTKKLPESYLIDRAGNLRYQVVSSRDWNHPQAQRCIAAMLAE